MYDDYDDEDFPRPDNLCRLCGDVLLDDLSDFVERVCFPCRMAMCEAGDAPPARWADLVRRTLSQAKRFLNRWTPVPKYPDDLPF